MTDDHKLTEDSARWRKLADELAGKLEGMLGYAGWQNYSDAELIEEISLGNEMVVPILEARTALSSYRREAA